MQRRAPDHAARAQGSVAALESGLRSNSRHKTVRGIGIDYPKPNTIGPDPPRQRGGRAPIHFGAPSVVVDFGTGGDVRRGEPAPGDYVGGIIAPGVGGHDRLSS